MESKKFHYDEYSDSLIISNRRENEYVERNFEIGDIIFSLTGKGKIDCIEIRGASSFFESCNINPELLKNATTIEMQIVPKRGAIFLLLKIESSEGENILSKNIPLVVPIISR